MSNEKQISQETMKELLNNMSQDEKNKLDKLNNLIFDKDFRQKLIDAPNETLKNAGFDIPAGKRIIVLESQEQVGKEYDDTVIPVILPPMTSNGIVADDEMEGVAGGSLGEATNRAISFVSFLYKVVFKGGKGTILDNMGKDPDGGPSIFDPKPSEK